MIENYIAINLMRDKKTSNFYCSECGHKLRNSEFYEDHEERWYDVEFAYCPRCGREILNYCTDEYDELTEKMKKEINDGKLKEDTSGVESPEKPV
jgi:predicted RNA-binding Zn-ribbon protein involved in translation (DUF1610 family)